MADTVNSTETRIKDVLVQTQSVAPAVLSLRNIDLLTKEEPMNIESMLYASYMSRLSLFSINKAN